MIDFRLDRFLTLYLFHPLTKLLPHNKGLKIPILMYHSISDDRENDVHPYYRINTSPDIFEKHMKFLYENDYTVIDIHSIKNYLDLNANTDRKYVVITFDDGYDDFYTNAFPILKKYNFTATVFLPAGLIGQEECKLKNKKYLDWEKVRILYANGISFGSHTVTHPQLATLSKDNIELELKQSKEIIEDKLGNSINAFSYPFKFPEENREFKKTLKELLLKHGYEYGVCTSIGRMSKKEEIYFMKRLPANSNDDILLFRAKLEGGYDWVYKVQLLFKMMKRVLKHNF